MDIKLKLKLDKLDGAGDSTKKCRAEVAMPTNKLNTRQRRYTLASCPTSPGTIGECLLACDSASVVCNKPRVASAT